jgi:DNA-directed RNA polymerase subunit RPC12/RpoP
MAHRQYIRGVNKCAECGQELPWNCIGDPVHLFVQNGRNRRYRGIVCATCLNRAKERAKTDTNITVTLR